MTQPGEAGTVPSGSGNGNENNTPRVNFQDEDGTDGTNAATKAESIKIDIDRKNLKAWFQRLEIRLEFIQVKSQWLKRVVLENMLPADLAECLNDLFIQPKSEADQFIYRECKQHLLAVHGPKPVDDFNKARGLVLGGLPSDTAKRIRDLVCQKPKKLAGCCCHVAIEALWTDLLPEQVKAAVAGLDLQNNFEAVIKQADAVFKATQPKGSVIAAAVTQPTSRGADLDTSADEPAFERINQLAEQLAAVTKSYRGGRGRGQPTRGRRGWGQAGKSQPKPAQEKAPDNACWLHKKYGKKAFHCADKDNCPWKEFCVKKPE